MTAVAVILVVMSSQGHWLGGRDNPVQLRWLLDQPMPAATLRWQLQVGRATLAEGSVTLDAGALDQPATIQVRCPAVRVRTSARWQWSLSRRDDGATIGSGEQPVFLYPDNQLESLARRLGDARIVIVDDAESLPALFTDRGIVFRRLDSIAPLAFTRADLIIIGQDRIVDTPFIQQPLPGLIESGAAICVLHQSRPGTLLGYPVVSRGAASALKLVADHPLIGGLEDDIAASWLRDMHQRRQDLHPIRLPAAAPALELIHWPYDLSSALSDPPILPDDAGSIDVLMLTQTRGKGRIIFNQVPLGPWRTDVRSQQWLVILIDFLMGPPQATPSPLDRHKTKLAGERP
jgi:hypothetical protein